MSESRTGGASNAVTKAARVGILALLLVLLTLLATGPAGPAAAETTETDTAETDTTEAETDAVDGDEADAVDPAAEALDEQLRLGAEVYTGVCSSCHQPGGAGLPGQYPPLVDNPNVDDADYVMDTIINGRQGVIVVAGETYDGVMPSFSTLSDAEIEAVVVYIQNDFQAPQAAIDEFAEQVPVAGTELPELATMSAALAFLVFAAAVGMVLAPRFTSVNDRLNVPWLDAWFKTGTIVAAVVVLCVLVPNWALTTTPVTKLSRFGQDVVGVGLFGIGLVLVIGGLWYAHREQRI